MNKSISIVTGAAKGIGLAISKRLIANGHFVVLVDVDTATGTSVAGEFGTENATFIPCNISNIQDVEALFQQVEHDYSTVDVVVNNAGIIRDNVIWKMPESKVSIDGRFRTVYPEEVINKSWSFSMGLKGWKAMIDDYPTEVILTRKSDQAHSVMDQEKNWIQIYDDPLSKIYIPKTSPPSPILQKFYEKILVDSTDLPSSKFP